MDGVSCAVLPLSAILKARIIFHIFFYAGANTHTRGYIFFHLVHRVHCADIAYRYWIDIYYQDFTQGQKHYRKN